MQCVLLNDDVDPIVQRAQSKLSMRWRYVETQATVLLNALVARFINDRWDNTVGVCNRLDTRLDDGALGSFQIEGDSVRDALRTAPMLLGERRRRGLCRPHVHDAALALRLSRRPLRQAAAPLDSRLSISQRNAIVSRTHAPRSASERLAQLLVQHSDVCRLARGLVPRVAGRDGAAVSPQVGGVRGKQNAQRSEESQARTDFCADVACLDEGRARARLPEHQLLSGVGNSARRRRCANVPQHAQALHSGSRVSGRSVRRFKKSVHRHVVGRHC
jgi:hypothetical protein